MFLIIAGNPVDGFVAFAKPSDDVGREAEFFDCETDAIEYAGMVMDDHEWWIINVEVA